MQNNDCAFFAEISGLNRIDVRLSKRNLTADSVAQVGDVNHRTTYYQSQIFFLLHVEVEAM
jgi:hypothetical protein